MKFKLKAGFAVAAMTLAASSQAAFFNGPVATNAYITQSGLD